MKPKLRECKTCFLTDDFPGIRIDEDGICNDCKQSKASVAEASSIAPLGIEALKELGNQIHSVASKKSKYDCIIGASGGLDSTYVIYLAIKEMGLNPLVVKYRNGFGHPLADENITGACEKLGVDLVIVEPIALERQYLYLAIKALRNLDVFFSSCFSCHFTIAAIVYKLAKQHNIDFMLTSTNPFESQLSVTSHGFMLRQLWKAFWKTDFISKLKFIMTEIQAQITLARLKLSFDGLSLRWLKNVRRLHPVTPENIKKVNISRYVPWDIRAIENQLREALNWHSPRESEVPYMRFDCHVLNLI